MELRFCIDCEQVLTENEISYCGSLCHYCCEEDYLNLPKEKQITYVRYGCPLCKYANCCAKENVK